MTLVGVGTDLGTDLDALRITHLVRPRVASSRFAADSPVLFRRYAQTMSTFSHEELVHIAQSVEPIRGWDFSRAGTSIDPVPWEYREVAQKFLSPEHQVLDIATGGGEVFMTLAHTFRSGVGVDSEPVMIQTAEETRAQSQF
jgi:2-polyprenyl-3-methyl-5-hydroxy-6-metoxy-1,4-benzoquinol methylase